MGFFGPPASTGPAPVGALTAPTDISGLVVWFDFSDSTKIFDSNTGGSTPANGGAIGRIEDKSGNARNATQSTANNRPTYQTSIQNGLSVARFDGTNDTLDTASFSMASSISFFVVCARTWSTAKYANPFYSSNYGASAGYALSQALEATQDWNIRDWFFVGKGFNAGIPPRSCGGGSTLNGFTSNSFHIFSGRIGASAADIFIDKVRQTQKTTENYRSGNSVDTASASFKIGAAGWDRDIGEIFIYDSLLSDTNQQKAENYLANKWGL
jgi:hypothetical protein